jgi:hypothetical protein
MDHKTLSIIFSGISTLTPGPPRNGDGPPDKAFVMMAANVQKTPVIPDHFPFVHVAASLLVDPPPPAETIVAGEGGEHFIYFFRNARVVIYPPPKLRRIEYFIDPEKRPLADRPGSDDVAPPYDIRWLADLRDILAEPSPVKTTASPTATSISKDVAAIVDLDGGLLTANFPCDSVHPRSFVDAQGKVVPGRRRALASEFIIDIPYPLETDRITLRFQDLRSGTPMDGPKELVVLWPRKETQLVVRIGHDTKNEVRRLNTPQRFDPVRETGPVLKPRDEEFDLHYNLLQISPGIARPVPQNDPHQCGREGCKPATG